MFGLVGSTLARRARCHGQQPFASSIWRTDCRGRRQGKPKLLGRLDGEQRTIQRHGLIENVAVGLQRRIGRDEEVCSIKLDAVAGR
ncbi:hypothetical protein AB7M74_000975 [Bradyrhizobium japonicum]